MTMPALFTPSLFLIWKAVCRLFHVTILVAGLTVPAILDIVLYAMTAIIEKRYMGWAFRCHANR